MDLVSLYIIIQIKSCFPKVVGRPTTKSLAILSYFVKQTSRPLMFILYLLIVMEIRHIVNYISLNLGPIINLNKVIVHLSYTWMNRMSDKVFFKQTWNDNTNLRHTHVPSHPQHSTCIICWILSLTTHQFVLKHVQFYILKLSSFDLIKECWAYLHTSQHFTTFIHSKFHKPHY